MKQKPDSPRVYRSFELAEIMTITPAMVRKYSDTFETVTQQTITRERRARIYNQHQADTLQHARALVDAGGGTLTIEQALKRVLGIEILIEPASTKTPTPTPLETLLEKLEEIRGQNVEILERLGRLEGRKR